MTNREWDLFLYLGKLQNNMGMIEGVYYQDAIHATNMCKQSFYNALYGLSQKGIIQYKKLEADYDIQILGNGFPNNDYSEGYINLNRKAFRTLRFIALKAHEKFLVLDWLKITHENTSSYQVGTKHFYAKYRGILRVTARVIRGYLKNLKKFFSIGIKEKKYFITYMHSTFKERFPRAEEKQYFDHCIRRECRRKRISYDEPSVQDTTGLIGQYRALKSDTLEMLELLYSAILKSVEGKVKKERVLNARYVHKCIQLAL